MEQNIIVGQKWVGRIAFTIYFETANTANDSIVLYYMLCCTYEFLSVDKSTFSIFIYKYI